MSRITNGKVSVGWASFLFRFHNFAHLSTTKDNYIASPEFTCNGHQWQLEVYPGGEEDAAEGMVSVFIRHLSEGTTTVKYRISFMDKFGKTKYEATSECREFSSCDSWGFQDFISRSDIVDESKNILDSDGTLTIVVSMRDTTSVFVPKNTFLKMMKEVFDDETTADVCFKVASSVDGTEGEEKGNDTFHAHRLILKKCAPMLASLFGSNDTADITDIDSNVFRLLLYYVYGKDIPEEELKTHAKDIIDAADKYSIINLKLAAEAAYVESIDITIDNAIDNLLYADAKNCALLKEKVMQFLADNHHEAAEKISFTDCPGHVMKDLLVAFGRSNKKDSDETNTDELATLCVNDLRRKLAKLGLEVDGSREAMIESIKAHSAS